MADTIVLRGSPITTDLAVDTSQTIALAVAAASAAGSGSGDLYYAHTQGVASATWAITHNLGKRPSVTVIDSGGDEVVPAVTYTSANVVTLSFSGSVSGVAYLN